MWLRWCGPLQCCTVQEILNELEKSINDRELLEVVSAERDDLPYVKASANRLQKDDYDRIMVGDYKEKARNRTAVQARQRKKYEVCLLLWPDPAIFSLSAAGPV